MALRNVRVRVAPGAGPIPNPPDVPPYPRGDVVVNRMGCSSRGILKLFECRPLTSALSPNPRNGDGGPKLGEREDIVGTLTQGGARGDGGPAAPASRLPWATIRRPAGAL